MLGLKYMMAKSKELTSELTSKLERSTGSGSMRQASSADAAAATNVRAGGIEDSGSSITARRAGEAFLLEQHKAREEVLARHKKLVESGEQVGEELARARKRLQEQVESEAYISQHFHEVTQVREQLQQMRGLVDRIASEVERVEEFLVKQTEQHMAAENASFAARQQHELERFEHMILSEKEERKRQLLQERREVLAEAFQKDLKAYQALRSSQATVQERQANKTEPEETLESIDLAVVTDSTQLDDFYHTDDESSSLDEAAPAEGDIVPDEKEEEEEEKEDKSDKEHVQEEEEGKGIEQSDEPPCTAEDTADHSDKPSETTADTETHTQPSATNVSEAPSE